MPSIHCQIPGAPHGSIVLAGDKQALARVFDSGVTNAPSEIQIVGRTLGGTASSPGEGEPCFSRQKLALGEFGQARLRHLRVGVVGLGGTGALVSMQLAHLGVGELVLIDGDLVEESNLSRIVGVRRDDVGRTHKVDVAARYAEELGFVRKVESVREFLDGRHEPLVGSCDIVVCCVDRHTPRALLNRIAYNWLVPIIDMGTAFRVDVAGTMVGDAGRVVVVGPNRPCLGCWGHIDPHALRVEALPAEEREGQIQEGYIEGANEVQPSVIAFNTAVAGAAVTELLRLVTGFAGAESPPQRLAFAFSEGTVRRNVLHSNPRCAICGDF
jgi:molybdopterin/thiamine biosynthesis adenylyltransferase